MLKNLNLSKQYVTIGKKNRIFTWFPFTHDIMAGRARPFPDALALLVNHRDHTIGANV